jgi:hypothetical protein
VYVGEPIDSSGDRDVVAAELQRSVTALLHQAQAEYPDDGVGQWWQPQRLGGSAVS